MKKNDLMTDDEKLKESARKAVELAQTAKYPVDYVVLFATKAEWKAKVGTEWPGPKDCQDDVRHRFILSNGEIECD